MIDGAFADPFELRDYSLAEANNVDFVYSGHSMIFSQRWCVCKYVVRKTQGKYTLNLSSMILINSLKLCICCPDLWITIGWIRWNYGGSLWSYQID